jgi:hypothetical protein
MCPYPGLDVLEGSSGDAVAGRANPAKVVLPAMDITPETQVVRFDAHLAERHIVIDLFDTRFFDIVLSDGGDLAHVGGRMSLQKERHQIMDVRRATTHDRQRMV